MSKTILLVDNFDSFTFNIPHLLAKATPSVKVVVVRNNAVFSPENFDGVIIGPGPGSPEDDLYFGRSKEIILNHGLQKGLPILGICLGFQGIFHFLGGKLKLGDSPVHGKISHLSIQKETRLLNGLPQGTPVMRYHSIVAQTSTTPDCINITSFARKSDGSPSFNEPMSLEHKTLPLFGVQFHPESFGTKYGEAIIKNFVRSFR